VVLDFQHKQGPVKVQAQNGKKKERKSGESKTNKKSSKKTEKKKHEVNINDDYELYSHDSTTSPSSASTLEVKDDLRKALEEKSKKYAHLPVYDRAAELQKAKEREAKMTAILSDMDRNLGAVSDLTSTHMESKGVTMVSTPFDDDSSSPERKDHTIKYKKHTLESREQSAKKSASKPQGVKSKSDTKTEVVSKVTKKETIVSESIKVNQNNVSSDKCLNGASQSINVKEELSTETKIELKQSDISENQKENGENNHDSSQKSDKQISKSITNLNADHEIPFADDPEEEDQPTMQAQTSNGLAYKTNPRKEHERSSSWRFMRMK